MQTGRFVVMVYFSSIIVLQIKSVDTNLRELELKIKTSNDKFVAEINPQMTLF